MIGKFKLAITPEDVKDMYDQDQEDHMRAYAELKARSKEGIGVSMRDGLRFGVGFALSTAGIWLGGLLVVGLLIGPR